MPQILLDVTRLIRRLHDGLLPTGVDRVGLAYVERYAPVARAVVSHGGLAAVMSERDSRQTFEALIGQMHRRALHVTSFVRAYRNLFDGRHFTPGVFLHTSHNGMEFERLYRTMRRRGVRSVFMIHDLIPLSHAEYCRPGVDAAHRARLDTALALADGLIANSLETARMLAAYAATAKRPGPPCVVAPLAPGVTRAEHRPRPLDAPYFVMLGTIEPRKNHWFMLHVWRRLVEQHGAAAPRLVIIGRRGWECENVIDMLERCATLREHVIELAGCNDIELHTWMTHARALLFPSFVEGYGMPIVEALTLRLPVLASDLDVFHEVAGEMPDYLDPLDGPGWTARILAYAAASSPERDAQLERIGHFHAPTWDEHFQRVDQFLESLNKP